MVFSSVVLTYGPTTVTNSPSVIWRLMEAKA